MARKSDADKKACPRIISEEVKPHESGDIVTGAVFPDYELSDHTGKHRKLSELQGADPMILVLSRGGYCPKDRRQAEGSHLADHLHEVVDFSVHGRLADV